MPRGARDEALVVCLHLLKIGALVTISVRRVKMAFQARRRYPHMELRLHEAAAKFASRTSGRRQTQ